MLDCLSAVMKVHDAPKGFNLLVVIAVRNVVVATIAPDEYAVAVAHESEPRWSRKRSIVLHDWSRVSHVHPVIPRKVFR